MASEKLASSSSELDVQNASLALSSTFAALELDAHLALDAAALARSIRLREAFSLSPLSSLSDSTLRLTVEQPFQRRASVH